MLLPLKENDDLLYLYELICLQYLTQTADQLNAIFIVVDILQSHIFYSFFPFSDFLDSDVLLQHVPPTIQSKQYLLYYESIFKELLKQLWNIIETIKHRDYTQYHSFSFIICLYQKIVSVLICLLNQHLFTIAEDVYFC